MKRLSDRIAVEFEAKLILNKNRYDGVINNLSADGICMTTEYTENDSDSFPGTSLEVELQFSSGEVMNIPCKVMWSNKDFISTLGLEISEKPFDYEDFFNSLYHNNMQVF